jgi:uncharacterized membrane-anchored protein
MIIQDRPGLNLKGNLTPGDPNRLSRAPVNQPGHTARPTPNHHNLEGEQTMERPGNGVRELLLNKVPEVTAFFWIVKIMATTIGETAADFLNFDLGFGLSGTSLFMGTLLVLALYLQIRRKSYVPWIYWVSVVLISVFGTLVTDNLVDNFGVSLQTTTLIFTLALGATFAVWYLSEKTLSIHSVFTTRRELFYWAAILFTFALGTAAGDLVSEKMNLGYLTSALIFGSLIGATTLAYYRLNLNATLAFWMAYILTRPFGASCGDFLSQSADSGGLALGTVKTSLFFLAVILSLVTYMTVAEKRKAFARS